MLISVYVFHAHYAAELSDNLLLFLLFFVVTLAMVSIGAVIGLVIKTSPMLIVMPPLWIMMAFSGTYSKELVFKGISDLMPIYQIQQAAFDLTVFGRSEKAGCVILICLIILIVMLAVGAFLFSRMEEER
jgi:ABC-2 type transport system permease protein